MFTSCFFGRTEWNRTVYFIRRIFLRWAAARHTQLFLLFLSTRLKKEPKKPTMRSFTATFSLLLFPGRADRWIRGSLFTHLHNHFSISLTYQSLKTKRNSSETQNFTYTLLKWQFTWKWSFCHHLFTFNADPKLYDFLPSVECKTRHFRLLFSI